MPHPGIGQGMSLLNDKIKYPRQQETAFPGKIGFDQLLYGFQFIFSMLSTFNGCLYRRVDASFRAPREQVLRNPVDCFLFRFEGCTDAPRPEDAKISVQLGAQRLPCSVFAGIFVYARQPFHRMVDQSSLHRLHLLVWIEPSMFLIAPRTGTASMSEQIAGIRHLDDITHL